MQNGRHNFNLKADSIYSLYLLSGKINIEGNEIFTDTFVRIADTNTIDIEAMKDSDLFILQSPVKVDYKLVSEK